MDLKTFENFKKRMAVQFEMIEVSEITDEEFISSAKNILTEMENQSKMSSFYIDLHSMNCTWDTPEIQFTALECSTCKGTYKRHPDEDGCYLVENECFSNDGWVFRWFCCQSCLKDYAKKLSLHAIRAHMEGYRNGRAKKVKT